MLKILSWVKAFSKIMLWVKYGLRLDNVVNEHNTKQIFSLTVRNEGNLSQKI